MYAWKIEDDALVTQNDVPNIDLVTKENYQDFELVFDWKVSEAGNSGLFFHVQEVADQEYRIRLPGITSFTQNHKARNLRKAML